MSSMSLLKEGIEKGYVRKTEPRETASHIIDDKLRVYDVYEIRTDLLYYNDQNDRIATWVSEYNAAHDGNLAKLPREEYNDQVEKFIVESNVDALRTTENSIKLRGQREAGVVLNDGRVIDGNRRLTCVRRIARANNAPGWFKAVILDDATGSDPKRIKMLELAIQIGEEEKVAYDPVDRLVGVYRDIIKNKMLTPAEYARATGTKESEVNKLVERAQYMEDFLEFCGAPEQYHLARQLKVDGPLGEFSSALKKQKSQRDRELTKRILFSNIIVQPGGDPTRYVRNLGKVAGTDAEPAFRAEEHQAMDDLLDKMGDEPLTVEKVRAIRADNHLVGEFSRAGEKARKTISRQGLVDTPAKKSEQAFKDLDQILPEMLEVLDAAELAKVRRSLGKVIEKAQDLTRDIDELA